MVAVVQCSERLGEKKENSDIAQMLC